MVVFDAEGKFVKSWGKEFKGGAHGLHIQRQGGNEFLYLCDTRRGVVVKATLEGEEVFTSAIRNNRRLTNRAPMASGPSTARLIWPSRPTATSMSATATAPVTSTIHSKGEYIRTFGGKGKEPGKVDCPHGIAVDMRGAAPILTVADRANNRIQRFTLAGEHLDFIAGTNLPCHFSYFRNGRCGGPDLGARGHSDGTATTR